MKRLKQIIAILVVTTLVATSFSTNVYAKAKTPRLNKSSLSLYVGKSYNLKIKGSVKKKSFKSKNKKIITVNKKGKVTAKKKGKTTIICKVYYKSGKKTRTKILKCKVIVKKKTPISTPESTHAVIPTKPSIAAVPSNTIQPTVPPVVTSKPDFVIPTIPAPIGPVSPNPTPSTKPDDIKVPATTEVPKATDIPIRPTETPSTTESPSVPTVVPTDAPTTEPSVVPTPSSTPEVKYDYIGDYGNHKYGYICKQKPSTTQEGIYWATTLDIPDYDGGNYTEISTVPKLDGYETLDGIECGYCFYEKPTCINEGIKDYYDLRTGNIIKSTRVPATGHTLDGAYYCDNYGYIGRKCKDCDIKVDEIYLLSPANDQMEKYTRWGTKPSTTQDGVLEVYLGKDISKLSADELNKYTKFDIVYDSSCATKYKTNTVYCSKKGYEFNDCDVYAIEASTNPSEYVNSVYFPKYTEVTVKTDHGDKTMIGYYDTEMADDVITYLNEYRVQNGLSELKKSQTATDIAQLRSAEHLHNYFHDLYNYCKKEIWNVDSRDYPAHTRSDKSDIETLNTDTCFLLAENEMVNGIFLGLDSDNGTQTSNISAEVINKRFMDSTGHRENMLNNIANGIGISVFVGYYVNNDGTFDTIKSAVIQEEFVYDKNIE